MTRPTISAPERSSDNVTPIIERSDAGLPLWVIVAVAALGAVLLFGALESRRRSASIPALPESAASAVSESLPALVLPAEVVLPPSVPPAEADQPSPPAMAAAPSFPPYRPPPASDELYRPPSFAPARSTPGVQSAPRPALVMDTSILSTPTPTPAPAADRASALPASGRVQAGVLASPQNTVVQGTLITAVLETAIDSTMAGQVTALVQRDVRGFDGSQVLIPRGSRLIGELRVDTAPGQERANVVWTRLIRPGGATMALQSLAADTLGRAGIKGKVDGHFWERFGGTLLESSLDIGANLALSARGNGSVVLLPGLGAVRQAAAAEGPRSRTTLSPTIKVAAGKSISVAVMQDLDFTRVQP